LPTSPGEPDDIVVGPDGNMWYSSNHGRVGRVTTSGTVTEFTGPDDSLAAIAAGPNGKLYATDGHGIFEITTSGVITVYPSSISYQDIIQGPDKQMWISGDSQTYLREFNPTTHVLSQLALDPLAGLTLGSDGDVWIADRDQSILLYEERVTIIAIRLNGELSFNDPNYGFELGYAHGHQTTQTETISLRMGESVKFRNVDTEPHSAAFLGDATSNNAPWPGSFNGSTTTSPAGTAIGTTGWATGSLKPNTTSPIYETGLPGFYMIGCQYHYDTNQMRTVIIVH
jgi:plastocyanin